MITKIDKKIIKYAVIKTEDIIQQKDVGPSSDLLTSTPNVPSLEPEVVTTTVFTKKSLAEAGKTSSGPGVGEASAKSVMTDRNVAAVDRNGVVADRNTATGNPIAVSTTAKKTAGMEKAGTEKGSATEKPAVRSDGAKVVHMHEKVRRPEMLLGSTYKIRTPLSEHSLYVTINDIILNPGTEHELRRPFEIFINSKNMDHFQWIVALTRIISAVFRKGGDVTFLVDELRSVFDPRGGYFKKGGKYMPSLVAEIGDAIESHLVMIGLLKQEGPDKHQKQMISEKRSQYQAAENAKKAQIEDDNDFPAGSHLCGKCQTKAVIRMDGCMTCLNCGDSKCG